MRTPQALQALIDDGVIDEVVRPLKSGKEAAVYVVRGGGEVLCAKVYKDMAQRSFQQRVQYQEGRKVRGSRQARAIGKASRYGRRQQEEAWKNTEVEALYQLREAGVRVPEPHGFHHGVLVMEMVTDADGFAAPRLGEYAPTPDEARRFHAALVRDVVRMLCSGLIHGDLSPYNVLVDAAGPVLIDFPQVVSAGGNNAARAMLLRDVNNLTATLGAFAPELLDTWYGEEMWALFEAGDLLPDTPLTGKFVHDERSVDLDGVRDAINDAREEALIRQQGREAAAEQD
jgi:RIO kinase 1